MNSIRYITEWVKNSCQYEIAHSLNGMIIKTCSNEVNAIKWMNNYHFGYFECVGPATPHVQIYGVYVGSTSFQQLAQYFAYPEEIEMFFGHTGCFNSFNLFKIYYDPISSYIHINDGNEHYLIICYKNTDSNRILGRVEREILFEISTSLHLRFHGGSIYDEHLGGMLIVGEKGKGKTTLLLGALSHGAQFGSNDRTEVYEKNQEFYYCGVPTSVRISEEQIDYIEKNNKKKFEPQCFKDIGLNKGKWEYSPQEVSDFFATSIINDRPIKYVLVPDFGKDKICVNKITTEADVLLILKKNVFIYDQAFSRYFSENKYTRTEKEMLDKMINTVQFFSIDGWLYDFDVAMLK